MKLTDFLSDVGKPIAYYPGLKKITGSTTATILLCQFFYWRGKESDPDGWLYKTSDEIEEETGLTYDEQKTARNKLVENELIEEHYARLDHQMKFRINLDVVNTKWGNEQPTNGETGITRLGKAESPNSLNESETTTETTTEKENKHKFQKSKEDSLGGYLDLLAVGQETEKTVEAILDKLEEGLKRNIPRTPQWQALAKWIQKQDISLAEWVSWYMADVKYRAENSWRLTPEQIRNAWPQAKSITQSSYNPQGLSVT